MWTEVVVPLIAAAIGAGGGYLGTRSSAVRAADAAERATREAQAARESSRDAERLRRLDTRVQEASVKAYSPMLMALGDMLSKTCEEKNGGTEGEGPGTPDSRHERFLARSPDLRVR